MRILATGLDELLAYRPTLGEGKNVKQTLLELMSRMNSLSQLANQEAADLKGIYGIENIATTKDYAEIFVNEPKPAHVALEAFVRALPLSVLFSTLVLMYAGRVKDAPLDSVDSYCRGAILPTAAELAITEKHPSMKYIASGIDSLGTDRLQELHERVREALSESQVPDNRPDELPILRLSDYQSQS